MAKLNGVKLTGKREAYAAIILRLVAEELKLPIKIEEIMRSQMEPLEMNEIRKATKKLRNTFKEWFRNIETPEELIIKKCAELNWPEEIKNDALFIVMRIKSELEGVQAMTVVGVALYLLNLRIISNSRANEKYKDYKRSE